MLCFFVNDTATTGIYTYVHTRSLLGSSSDLVRGRGNERGGRGGGETLPLPHNIDEGVTLDAEHPLRVATEPESGEPSPYIRLREGIEALIVRSVFYDLVERAEERPGDGGESWLEIGRASCRERVCQYV